MRWKEDRNVLGWYVRFHRSFGGVSTRGHRVEERIWQYRDCNLPLANQRRLEQEYGVLHHELEHFYGIELLPKSKNGQKSQKS